MSDTGNNGTGTEAQTTQDAATAGGQTPQNTGTETRTFTQEEVNRLIAKELKPFKEIKSEYEKIQQQIKTQQDAEKTELQKALEEVQRLSSYESKATSYETVLSEILEKELESIPEEFRARIPEELSVSSKLKYIASNRDWLIEKHSTNGQARTTQMATKNPDHVMNKAIEQMSKIWPRVLVGSDEYKRKLDGIYSAMKESV